MPERNRRKIGIGAKSPCLRCRNDQPPDRTGGETPPMTGPDRHARALRGQENQGVVGSSTDDEDADDEPLLGEPDASGYRRPLPGFSTKAPRLSSNDRLAE